MLAIADFTTFGVLFQIMTAAHDIIKCTLKVYLVADEKNAIPEEFLGKLQASENWKVRFFPHRTEISKIRVLFWAN